VIPHALSRRRRPMTPAMLLANTLEAAERVTSIMITPLLAPSCTAAPVKGPTAARRKPVSSAVPRTGLAFACLENFLMTTRSSTY